MRKILKINSKSFRKLVNKLFISDIKFLNFKVKKNFVFIRNLLKRVIFHLKDK